MPKRFLRRVLLFMFAMALAVAPLPESKLAAAVTVACVGDDLTLDAGVPQTYPVLLQSILGSTNYTVTNYGVAGATVLPQNGTNYSSTPQYTNSRLARPNIVVITLGINDSQQAFWPYLPNFPGDYATLVNSYINLPNHPKVFICTPTVSYFNFNGIYEDHVVSDIIPGIQNENTRFGVPLIDLHSRLAPYTNTYINGVFPNAIGCRRITGAVYQGLLAAHAVATPPGLTTYSFFPVEPASSSLATRHFSVTFNNPLADLDVTGIRLVNCGNPVLSNSSGDFKNYNLQVAAAATGVISVTFPAGTLTDLYGGTNASDISASTSFGGNGISDHPGCGSGSGLGLLLAVTLLLAMRRMPRKEPA